MSDTQSRLKEKYKRSRSRLIVLQGAVITVLTLLVIISAVTYAYISGTYYIEYTETGDIDYKVRLKDNGFYSTDYLGKDMTYVSSLVDGIIANLKYEFNTDAEDRYYDYSYNVEAELKITDKRSGEAIFAPVYPIKSGQRTTQSTNDMLRINELVVIDYGMYNGLATDFVNTYELTDAVSTLCVRMTVTVYGDGTSLDGATSSAYTSALNIPLADKTVNIEMTSSVPTAEKKLIACDAGAVREVFGIAAAVLAAVDVIAVLLLIAFVCLTRTKDITYAGRIRKILSHYKAYIQKITAPFDKTGYNVVFVDKFDELLEIRDTVSSPILMYGDEASTEFVIPTDSGILYWHEIRLEDAKGADVGYADGQPDEKTEDGDTAEENGMNGVCEAECGISDSAEEPSNAENVCTEECSDTAEEPKDVCGDDSGIEVIGVVWPERKSEKIYKYDPNGEKLGVGDIVLVPSHDTANDREVVREAEVALANHKVSPDEIDFPLKKIIKVVRRRAEQVFNSMIMGDGTDK